MTMQVQLLPVQRISINTSLAKQMGSRKREEMGNSSYFPYFVTRCLSKRHIKHCIRKRNHR